MVFDHTHPHHSQTAATAEQPRTWHTPVLTPLGSLQALTAGGSLNGWPEPLERCTTNTLFVPRC